jgi:hypothetical protein
MDVFTLGFFLVLRGIDFRLAKIKATKNIMFSIILVNALIVLNVFLNAFSFKLFWAKIKMKKFPEK